MWNENISLRSFIFFLSWFWWIRSEEFYPIVMVCCTFPSLTFFSCWLILTFFHVSCLDPLPFFSIYQHFSSFFFFCFLVKKTGKAHYQPPPSPPLYSPTRKCKKFKIVRLFSFFPAMGGSGRENSYRIVSFSFHSGSGVGRWNREGERGHFLLSFFLFFILKIFPKLLIYINQLAKVRVDCFSTSYGIILLAGARIKPVVDLRERFFFGFLN